jgi:hypothetical protein
MVRELEKEIFDYKESKDDPEIPKIPKETRFEAWLSFCIV